MGAGSSIIWFPFSNLFQKTQLRTILTKPERFSLYIFFGNTDSIFSSIFERKWKSPFPENTLETSKAFTDVSGKFHKLRCK